MCGIAGQISLSNNSLYLLENKLDIMANLFNIEVLMTAANG